ncbi:2989_t:CDS:2, partial [Rhizophagus irregularis]
GYSVPSALRFEIEFDLGSLKIQVELSWRLLSWCLPMSMQNTANKYDTQIFCSCIEEDA